jgi:hypothetical protein
MQNIIAMNDWDLLQLSVQGDMEAFAELMKRFDGLVRSKLHHPTDENVADLWCRFLARIRTSPPARFH